MNSRTTIILGTTMTAAASGPINGNQQRLHTTAATATTTSDTSDTTRTAEHLKIESKSIPSFIFVKSYLHYPTATALCIRPKIPSNLLRLGKNVHRIRNGIRQYADKV